jgi:hypothetical protein
MENITTIELANNKILAKANTGEQIIIDKPPQGGRIWSDCARHTPAVYALCEKEGLELACGATELPNNSYLWTLQKAEA